MSLLSVRSLSAGYGDIQALWDVNVSVEKGKATVILGRNGAGKSTLLTTIAGLLPAKAGTISLHDKDITRMKAFQRARQGLALVQENKRIFRRLSVEHNLMLGGYSLQRSQRKQALAQAYERFPILAVKRNASASTLSGGQQQMLAIAQALMPAPAVLMLDEPSAGLAPAIVNEVIATVAALKKEGLGVILVEQLVEQAMSIADDVIVLEQGRGLLAKPASEIDAHMVREVYLGSGKQPHHAHAVS